MPSRFHGAPCVLSPGRAHLVRAYVRSARRRRRSAAGPRSSRAATRSSPRRPGRARRSRRSSRRSTRSCTAPRGASSATGIDVVYVSPLKALSSDVQKNLRGAARRHPRRRRASSASTPPDIRTALRTGDTTAGRPRRDRQATRRTSSSRRPSRSTSCSRPTRTRALLRQRAHRDRRRGARAHARQAREPPRAVAGAPRRARREAARSASASRRRCTPSSEAARFLVGAGTGRARSSTSATGATSIWPSSCRRRTCRRSPRNEQWSEIYDRLAALVGAHRTTLVFVNTRRMAERVAHHLGERLGEDRVGAHHGSLAKDRRLRIEQRLKAGEMRALVATASLELGIDVGLGRPRLPDRLAARGDDVPPAHRALGPRARAHVARAPLRDVARRARRVRGARARGGRRAARSRRTAGRRRSTCSRSRSWPSARRASGARTRSSTLVRTAAPVRAASSARRLRRRRRQRSPRARRRASGRAGALLHRDRVNGVLSGRRAARLVAVTNGGAIPDVADYRVVLDPDETLVGTVNEDWAIESMAGDVFVLGSHSWRIRRVESRSGVLRVEDAQRASRRASPSGSARRPSRTLGAVGGGEPPARRTSARAPRRRGRGRARTLVHWLAEECVLGPIGAAQLAEYVAAQRDALGVVPTMDDVVFERFFDESGGMQLVVHAPFGGRVNRAFGLALRKRFCVSFDFELQAAATDDAIVLSMGTAHSFPLTDAFGFVRSEQLDATLRQAVLQAPMFGTRWRWNASRALAVLRHERGKKVPPFLQRMRADDLLAAVFPAQVACQDNAPGGPIEVPEHPIVRQTVRDCLTRGDGHRAAARASSSASSGARSACTRATRPSRRPSRTRCSTRSPTRSSTTRRSRSGARAPCRSAGRCRSTSGTSARSIPTPSRASWPRRGPSRATPTSCTTRCSGLVAAPIEDGVVARVSTSSRAPGRAARAGRARVRDGERAHVRRASTSARRGARSRRTSTARRPTRDEALLALVRGHAEVCGPFTAERARARRWASRRGRSTSPSARPRERGARPARALHAGHGRRGGLRPAAARAHPPARRSTACAARSSR